MMCVCYFHFSHYAVCFKYFGTSFSNFCFFLYFGGAGILFLLAKTFTASMSTREGQLRSRQYELVEVAEAEKNHKYKCDFCVKTIQNKARNANSPRKLHPQLQCDDRSVPR